jgi:hypothetical protein
MIIKIDRDLVYPKYFVMLGKTPSNNILMLFDVNSKIII